MTNPTSAKFVCSDGSVMVVQHWPDGERTVVWHGFWDALKLMWRLIRLGIPVDVE